MTKINRRAFVGGAAAMAAGATILATKTGRAESPSEKVVLGLIGSGGRGRLVTRGMAGLPNVEVKYVCDVEDARAAAGAGELEKIQGKAPQITRDMRQVFDDRDVDAVIVGTPEHWHALATVWACQAGKDVFVEKNISASIPEGRKMIEAARKYNRLVDAGFQCRSAEYVLHARDYIAAGNLGKVLYVKAFGMLPFVYGGYPLKDEPDGDPPAGLDWDRWLGPVAERPYNKRLHRQWYGYWRFSGGNASDAIHTLDVARLVVGDPPHPKAVHCVGGRWQFDDGGDMPDVQIVTFEFDKLAMTFENSGFTPYLFKTPFDIRNADKFPYWPQNSSRIEIYGTKQMMYLGRHGGGWQAVTLGGTELGGPGPKVEKQEYGRFPDEPHFANFIDCVRTRNKPNGDVAVCHYSASLEHLANTALRAGNEKLVFDGQTERFTNNEKANALQQLDYRDPYRMPTEV
ncbi:MAG: Gfo/Idh/MocA family oxidoreductase [Rhodopirellula sp.]|nr:Gfo/Idh/MocA family oxidoreductase [Rhodopirellula sp.]